MPDIFEFYEQFSNKTEEKHPLTLDLFLNILRYTSKKALTRTDKDGQNILHKLVQSDSISYDAVKLVLKAAPELANMQDVNGRVPAQVIKQNYETANRPVYALLYEKTDNHSLKKMLSLHADIHIGRRQTNLNPDDEDDGIDYFDLVDIDEAPYLFKKPTLICFSGRGAYKADVAAQFARVARKAFHLRHKPLSDLQVLAAWYPGTAGDLAADSHAIHSQFLQADPDSPYFYTERFVKRFLKPLYMNNEKRLPFDTAQKNLRNVNVFAYSYGASILQLMSDVLSEDMEYAGFCEKEINQLQAQIFVLTAGANINPNNYKNHFTNYHIMNTEDEIVFHKMRPLLETKELPDGAFMQTELYKQPNQKVLLFSEKGVLFEHSPHHITSYFLPYPIKKGQQKMLSAKDCILTDALNNSIMNQKEKAFIPLSEMEKMPSECLFLAKEEDKRELLTFIQDETCPVLYKAHHKPSITLRAEQKENA